MTEIEKEGAKQANQKTPAIAKPIGLKDYLEFEAKEAVLSRERWAPEFEACCALADSYQHLTSSVIVHKQELVLPGRLLVEVESQMYGVASQLLKRRTTDGFSGTRRAIEATAIAYRVWKEPTLVEVFYTAYPNVEKMNDPKQWHPSNEYREAFKTGKLFEEKDETWERLKAGYSVVSAMSTHAGPGVLSNQERRDQQYFAHFVEANDQEIRRAWYFVNAMYFSILKVFLHILRSAVSPAFLPAYEMELISWRDKQAKQMDERTPWVAANKEKEKGLLGSVLRPEDIRFLLELKK